MLIKSNLVEEVD